MDDFEIVENDIIPRVIDPILSCLGEKPARVEVDALVALRIEKHSREAASGSLLGLEKDGVLTISGCFKVPAHSDDAPNDDFVESMLSCLELTGADNNVVGFYQTTQNGVFNTNWIQNMFDCQAVWSHSVVIDFDPVHSMTGTLSLRAYRLTAKFFDWLLSNGLRAISSDDVFNSDLVNCGVIVEIPVFVKNSSLVSAFMHENLLTRLIAPNLIARSDFVEKKLSDVLEALETFSAEQARHASWLRSCAREKNKSDANNRSNPARIPVEPSKIDALLLSHQVTHHFQQISSFFLPTSLAYELSCNKSS